MYYINLTSLSTHKSSFEFIRDVQNDDVQNDNISLTRPDETIYGLYRTFNSSMGINVTLANLTPIGVSIIERLLTIPGIVSCTCQFNRFSIFKEETFNWDEINPFVEDIINNDYNSLSLSRNTIPRIPHDDDYITHDIDGEDDLYYAMHSRIILSKNNKHAYIYRNRINNEIELNWLTRKGRKVSKLLLQYLNRVITARHYTETVKLIDNIDQITFTKYSIFVSIKASKPHPSFFMGDILRDMLISIWDTHF